MVSYCLTALRMMAAAAAKHCLVLYTDGSCRNNGSRDESKVEAGIGVFHEDNSAFNVSEGWKPEWGRATNERAELMAGIRALEMSGAAPNACDELEIRSDSSYLINGMNTWLRGWKRSGWRTANKKPVKNVDLWIKLDAAAKSHPAKKISWVKVSGHTDVKGNIEADRLATTAPAEARHAPPAKKQKQ